MSDAIDVLRLAAERVAAAETAVIATKAMQAGPRAAAAYYAAQLELEMALDDAHAAMNVAKQLAGLRMP